MEGQATLHIDASPEALFALVSDVTRMGDWSPETVACEWLDGADGPGVGARFKGTNKMGPFTWSTTPTVIEVVPGKVFAFDAGSTTWRYTFTEDNGGTSVTESFVMREGWRSGVASLVGRRNALLRGMQKTLERLKKAAEG